MRGSEFLEKLEFLDPDLIEAAEARPAPAVRARRWAAWGALAACLCLAVAVAAVAARGKNGKLEQSGPAHPGGAGGSASQSQSVQTPEATQAPEVSEVGNPALRTSEIYETLPELLEVLGANESHSGRDSAAGYGGSALAPADGCNVALDESGQYAYHIGEGAVQISRLDGENTRNVGSIPGPAGRVFCCRGRLWVIRTRLVDPQEDPWVDVDLYDLADPANPARVDGYAQRGELTACWMSGERLYLATGDGVCACGYSRLSDPEKYYPALLHGGEAVPWGDETIAILGEPARVQYVAVTVFDAAAGALCGQQALYGEVQRLFYGEDWLAVPAAEQTESYSENPVVYTFDGALRFTGAIELAKLLGAPAKNEIKEGVAQDGDYLGVTAVTRAGDAYRLLGVHNLRTGGVAEGYFLAMEAVPSGEARIAQLSAEKYDRSAYTEILWEPSRAVVCVGVTEDPLTDAMRRETRFLFVEFGGGEPVFHESALTADYLADRVGTGFGNPLWQIETLIPLGNGLYLRYTAAEDVPTGFDLFDLADSAAPRLMCRNALWLEAGEGALDYAFRVYSDDTFGTLRLRPGGDPLFRAPVLSWCVYRVEPDAAAPLTLVREVPLGQMEGAFFGADALHWEVFEADGQLYCTMDERAAAAPLQ